MAKPVMMPKQGQSVETCVITEWMKNKGDQVNKGDVIFSYETDKASFEYEAEDEGVLLELFYDEGDEVPVLTNVAVLGQEGEPVDDFKPGGEQASPDEKGDGAEEQVEESAEKEVSAEEKGEQVFMQEEIHEGDIRISPRAKRLAQQKGVYYQQIKGSGPKGRIIERDVEIAAKEMPRMTPAASQRAAGEGLRPSAEGQGVGGRVTSNDLVASNQVYGVDYENIKLSNIRKIIAKGMHESLQNSAQLTHHMSADVRKMQAFRKKVKKAMEEGAPDNITLNDMVCYVVIKALIQFPEANSHFLGEEMRQFKKVHLGLAVDTPRGLMVPALRNADDLSLKGLSSQLKGLADRCKQGDVDPELLSSTAASFTVSNLGGLGVEMFTPVLNLPQVGILGVNTITPRPKQLEDGVYGFVPHIGLSLTYDHRAIDGAPASRFLGEIKKMIENFDEEL